MRLVLVLPVLLTTTGWTASAMRRVDIARIEAWTGPGSVLRADATIAVQAGLALEPNDILRADAGALGRLALLDGSALLVESNSELRIVRHDADTQQTLVELLHGHLVADTVPVVKMGGIFKIHTPTAAVSSLGGMVDVQTLGQAEIEGLGFAAVRLVSGQQPLADVPFFLLLAKTYPIPIGLTNESGDATLALPFGAWSLVDDVVGFARLANEQLRYEVEACRDRVRAVYLVGRDAQAPAPRTDCNRRAIAGVFRWGGKQRAVVDAGRTQVELQALAAPVAPAPVPFGSLRDIPPDVRPAPGVTRSLAGAVAINETVVTALDRLIWVSSLDAALEGTTYLLPGEAGFVARSGTATWPTPINDLGAQAAFDLTARLNGYAIGRARAVSRTLGPPRFRDFSRAGAPCDPGWIVNGDDLSDQRTSHGYRVVGLGRSTGESLQAHVINSADCPLYFFVVDGTVLQPKGYSIAAQLLAGMPSLDSFQNMITIGGVMRVAAPAKDERSRVASRAMRSYCVNLHKHAPHQNTDYTFAGDDEQQRLAPLRPVIDRTFLRVQTGALVLSGGHSVDAVLQWSLWTVLERMNDRKFMEEFSALVRKNLEAQKRRWDAAARKDVDTSGRALWTLVQGVLQ
jgi:hypothetical protein